MQLTSIKIYFLFISALLFLAGCVPSGQVRLPTQLELQNHPLVTQAQALEKAGDHLGAAQLFEQSAAQFPPPSNTQLLLRAVENYFKGQDHEQAARLLSNIDTGALPQLDFYKQLLIAELALSNARPREALRLLTTPASQDADIRLQKKFHQLRAEGFRLSGNQLESANELSELDLLMLEEEERLKNQMLIVDTLATLTDTALELLQPSPPGIQGGWMELARIIKNKTDVKNTQSQLEKWRERFPSHPALPSLLEGYFKALRKQIKRPNHIAIMLPNSGPYAAAANALRIGFMAAYYKEPSEQRPAIAFYDSSNSINTWPLYQEAVASGAEMVIGPLSKDSVSQLARAGELAVPVLALNQVPPEVTPPENLFQLSLSPEDEASQAAERAWLDGHENAVVLTPRGGWGIRIYSAFQQRWEQLGGTLVEHQSYDTKQHDFGAPIQALLNIDESKARRKNIQRLLGKRLEFDPRRRQDARFIFLAAKPNKARQIRPQLQFHHASGLPIYGTSHLYTGNPAPKKDIDLEGVKFPDIPWLLSTEVGPLSRDQVSRSLGATELRYPRLYAMGIDSFKILPHLSRLRSSPREIFEGQTGKLFLDSIQQFHRQLVWAEMKSGTPKVLGYAPRLNSSLSSQMESAPKAELHPQADATDATKNGITPSSVEPSAEKVKTQ